MDSQNYLATQRRERERTIVRGLLFPKYFEKQQPQSRCNYEPKTLELELPETDPRIYLSGKSAQHTNANTFAHMRIHTFEFGDRYRSAGAWLECAAFQSCGSGVDRCD